MSLNKYMHPRNKYKNNKPSFLQLALKYPDFRKKVTQDDKGKVLLDFKDADALRALTTCLLKEDFDLTVELPCDRLVPTLPLRLNYLLWLEDIVGSEPGKWGIDIGTGASCVYPLLSATTQKWKFLATEADPENFFHAEKNVKANELQDQITVKKVSEGDILFDAVNAFEQAETFDFCMCNPPFFADHMEAQAVTTSRSVDRAESNSMSTASPQECITNGGEVGFVRQMIEESTLLKNKIRVYSSMVGKKTSLVQLKKELRYHKITKFSTMDFCQGKTMRWGIAWSFDDGVQFPKSLFEDSKKDLKPLQHVIKKDSVDINFNVHTIAAYLKNLFSSIKVHCYQGKMAKSYTSITLTATENTWCHQRRRRRQQKRLEENTLTEADEQMATDVANDDKNVSRKLTDSSLIEPTCPDNESSGDIGHQKAESTDCTNAINVDENEIGSKKRSQDQNDTEANNSIPSKKLKVDDGSNCHSDAKVENENVEEKSNGTAGNESIDGNQDLNQSAGSEQNEQNESINENDGLNQSTESTKSDSGQVTDPTTVKSPCVESDGSPTNYILKCVLRLKRSGEDIAMELEWLGGSNRELLHQVKTFLINRLSEKAK